jgi:predicted transcriptional regulator
MAITKYREKLDIIADILHIVSQKAKKTHIMHRANLNYAVLTRYIRIVTAASLVSFNASEQHYILTQKGEKFLRDYEDYITTRTQTKQYLKDESCESYIGIQQSR